MIAVIPPPPLPEVGRAASRYSSSRIVEAQSESRRSGARFPLSSYGSGGLQLQISRLQAVPGVKQTIKNITTAGQQVNSTEDGVQHVSSMEDCILQHSGFQFRHGLTYCNATYDSYLCWPPAEAGTTAFQNCPVARLSDTSRLAFRRCGLDGLWLGRRKNESNSIGWTNYTPCFPTEVQNLFGIVYDDESDPEAMFNIAQNTRYLEIFGFSISLLALLMSLVTFQWTPALHNIRTRIHRNLFFAMTIQVIVRLILYFDQAFLREGSGTDTYGPTGLDSMPYVCEACYVLLEYGISAMFCWMFIEGLFLHSIVTANALRETIPFRTYMIFGWGAPFFTTGLWAVATAVHYRDTTVHQCWYGYNFLPEYWILQGPRLAIVLTNLVFLLNILRVLIGKLNRSQDSEMMKVRKAARAALVLLPLLGITNILNMIEAPLEGPIWKFALWSYTTHFLRSFQGFFIALIYCFLNGEVRQVMVKTYTDWRDLRADMRRMRQASRAAGRQRRRRASTTFKPLEWVQGAFDNQCTDENIELDNESMARMYSDPNVLDNLPTIRFDMESIVTDEV